MQNGPALDASGGNVSLPVSALLQSVAVQKGRCSLLDHLSKLGISSDHPSRLLDLPIRDLVSADCFIPGQPPLGLGVGIEPFLSAALASCCNFLRRAGIRLNDRFGRACRRRIRRRGGIRRVRSEQQPVVGVDEERGAPRVVC